MTVVTVHGTSLFCLVLEQRYSKHGFPMTPVSMKFGLNDSHACIRDKAPKPVLNASESVKALLSWQGPEHLYTSNAAYLGERDTFIGNFHGLKHGLGTFVGFRKSIAENYKVAEMELSAASTGMDLAVVEKPSGRIPSFSKLEPIVLAKKGPSRDGDEAYIVGYQKSVNGINVIQGSYEGEIPQSMVPPNEMGGKSSYFVLHAPSLEGREAATLSGSPVLDKKGRLVGILATALCDASGRCKGDVAIINLPTIRKFLNNHKPGLAKALNRK